jgi:hypothetical protein
MEKAGTSRCAGIYREGRAVRGMGVLAGWDVVLCGVV